MVFLSIGIFFSSAMGDPGISIEKPQEDIQFDISQINSCITEAVSEGSGWVTEPIKITMQLMGGEDSNCVAVESGENALGEVEASKKVVAFRPTSVSHQKLAGWYCAHFEEVSDGSWRVNNIEAYDTEGSNKLEDRPQIFQTGDTPPNPFSSLGDKFDWENKGPVEFLEHLKLRGKHFVLGKVPEGWLKKSDIPGLIELIDSNEPCGAVVHLFDTMPSGSISSTPKIRLSKVGKEAIRLIEGYRKGRYPLYYKLSKPEKKEMLEWWKKQ